MCGSELLALPDTVQKVARLLQDKGHPHAPVMLDDAARTAQQAADALGVLPGQIAKSIVFKRRLDDVAVLVITSGDQRVDERKVEALVVADGKRLGRADAEFVKAKTGFSIGGVSPLAHATSTVVLVDRSLMRFEEIWAAAGHPHAVFRLSPHDLVRLTGAPVADFAVDVDEERQALLHSIEMVSWQAETVDETSPVPSPCVSVCRMSSMNDMCLGCFRTRNEIAGWSRSDDDDKRATWKLIEQRMAALK